MDPPPVLDVQQPWYDLIAAGTADGMRKTVEGRTGPPGKFDRHVGGRLVIRGPAGELTVTLAAVRHYPDLDSYIAGEGWAKIAPQTGSDKAARAAYLGVSIGNGLLVFSPRRVELRGGINALELRLD